METKKINKEALKGENGRYLEDKYSEYKRLFFIDNQNATEQDFIESEIEKINKKEKDNERMWNLSDDDFFQEYRKDDEITNKTNWNIDEAENKKQINKANSDKLVNYSFSESYIKETADILDILSKTDKNFPNVTVIVKDSVKGSQVYLGFSDYYEGNLKDTIHPQKQRFIYKTTKEERDYLKSVFEKGSNELRYSSHNGYYELFYPYEKNGKKVILYFSEQQRYGKLGS